jgi:hypothetical protein
MSAIFGLGAPKRVAGRCHGFAYRIKDGPLARSLTRFVGSCFQRNSSTLLSVW